MVDVVELNEPYIGCISFKESLVGGPPRFGEIETSPTGVCNYLYPPYFVHMLLLLILACYVFLYIMLNAIFIRHVIYIESL